MEQEEDLLKKLNEETARLQWSELERHFARGSVIKVATELDLLNVAVMLAEDNTELMKQLMDKGDVTVASIDDARHWTEYQPEFWAVVVAPWVLVQEIKPELNS